MSDSRYPTRLFTSWSPREQRTVVSAAMFLSVTAGLALYTSPSFALTSGLAPVLTGVILAVVFGLNHLLSE